MKNVIVINALASEYFDECRIKGSINVPLADLASFVKNADKNSTYVVHCASYSCPVSAKAWQIFHDAGFTDVYAYEGGMAEWMQMGYPVEGSCSLDYLQREETAQERGVKTIDAKALYERMKAAGLIS